MGEAFPLLNPQIFIRLGGKRNLPPRLQSVKLDRHYIQNTTLCGIGQIIGDGSEMGRSYLRWLLLMVERGTTVVGYIWCCIFTDPIQNDHWISVFLVLYHLISEFQEVLVGIWNLCLLFCSLVPTWLFVQYINLFF